MSRQPRTETVMFRVNPMEFEIIKQNANLHGMNVSDYCRACVQADMVADLDPKVIGHFFGLLAEEIVENVRSRDRARGRVFPTSS